MVDPLDWTNRCPRALRSSRILRAAPDQGRREGTSREFAPGRGQDGSFATVILLEWRRLAAQGPMFAAIQTGCGECIPPPQSTGPSPGSTLRPANSRRRNPGNELNLWLLHKGNLRCTGSRATCIFAFCGSCRGPDDRLRAVCRAAIVAGTLRYDV